MTTPSDDRVPEDDEDRAADAGSSRQEGAPGVELGMSGSGGTFEPEEDAAPEP